MINIKEQTKEKHIQVEKIITNLIFSESLQPNKYYLLLSVFYEAYKELESQIQKFEITEEMLLKRSKLGLLKKDIMALKMEFGEMLNLEKLSFKGISSEAEALGVMYVMEGATLGGKFILESLKKKKWVVESHHCNFFNSYGEERGAMWKEFNEKTSTYFSNDSASLPDYVEGAKVTFDYMHFMLVKNINR